MSRIACWGDYVLGAAAERAIQAIGYHSQGDRLAVSTAGQHARISYASAARGRDGYRQVACGVVGVILSLCRSYLPRSWRPLRIELDIPRPRDSQTFEDSFACPVLFDAPVVAVVFEAGRLNGLRAVHVKPALTTIDDVARARREPASRGDLAGVIDAQIWAQVLAGGVSIYTTARVLDINTRTLQRELSRAGTDFRSRLNAARNRRAVELLRGTNESITEISATLGYSSPAHLARAFRRAADVAPHEFRQRCRPDGVTAR